MKAPRAKPLDHGNLDPGDLWQYRALAGKGEGALVGELVYLDRATGRWTLQLYEKTYDQYGDGNWRLQDEEPLPASWTERQLRAARDRLANRALDLRGYDPGAEYLKAVVAGEAGGEEGGAE